jgi:hypothetical protein
MRNKNKFITALLALSLVANFAFADDTSPSGSSSGKFTCTTNADGTEQCVRQDGGVKPDDKSSGDQDEQKLESRRNKGQAIEQVEKNQLNRAQNAVDRLQSIVDRVEAYRAKMDQDSPDLASIDALIAKAKTQATDVKTAMDDLKTKAVALENALTAATSDSGKTAPKQQVKDLQTSTKVLKTKLNTLHSTLVSIVKLIKKDEAIKEEDKTKSDEQSTKQESETHNSSGSNANEENE